MTTTTYEIPLTPEAQTFTISLAAVTYQLTLTFCAAADVWLVSFAQEDGTPVLTSVPLVTGVDLLEPYGYLNFGGQLTCGTDGDASLPPTYDNLGVTARLFFTVEEVA